MNFQNNADPTIRNLKDDSPLDLAARFGRVEVVQSLLNKYPDLVSSVILNHSPLHLAAVCGHKQIVEILLNAGYNINTKVSPPPPPLNHSPLHLAAACGHKQIVEILLNAGYNINTKVSPPPSPQPLPPTPGRSLWTQTDRGNLTESRIQHQYKG